MILVWNDLMKDPVWSEIVHIEVHTQLHSATLVKANWIRHNLHYKRGCFMLSLLLLKTGQPWTNPMAKTRRLTNANDLFILSRGFSENNETGVWESDFREVNHLIDLRKQTGSAVISITNQAALCWVCCCWKRVNHEPIPWPRLEDWPMAAICLGVLSKQWNRSVRVRG